MRILRYLRLAWVLGINTYVIYLLFGLAETKWRLYHLLNAPQDWHEFRFTGISALILACGMVSEVLNTRIAKYINFGYFATVGLFFTIFGLIGRREPEALIFVPQVGLPALLIALVTFFAYWKRDPRRAPPEVPQNQA